MWSKGFSSEETKAAFLRVQELAAGVNNPERFAAYYGLWIGSLMRGALELARETGETFRREAVKQNLMPEAAAANRCLGLTCLIQGDLTAAQAHLGEALRTCRPEWDQETKVRFGADTGATAMAYLAQTMWLLGEFGQARALIDGAVARAVETAHIQTQCNTYTAKSLLDGLRGDTEDASNAAEVVVQLGRRHGLPLYLAWGTVLLTWASSRLGDRKTGLAKLEEALCAYSDQGNRAYVPFFQGLLAEIEAEEDADAAVWRIGEALALAGETKQRWGDAYLHRAYGEALLKRNPQMHRRLRKRS
jgi:adenylate cyclase